MIINRSTINFKIIIRMIGFLLMFEGFFMLAGVPFSIYYGSDDVWALVASAGITYFVGFLCWFFTRLIQDKNLGKREGFIIVSFTWIIISFFGTLPYLLSGAIPNFTDAFFETISGFSTTGASILQDVEIVPEGILFWRSITHWIGGMGIIVFSVAILPFLGTGGMQLISAEMSDPVKDKLHPRVREAAKRLWGIYLAITLAEIILLLFGGMNLFESFCHTFGSVGTGGFSTRNNSIGAFNPYIQYVIAIFMILGATNFALQYFVAIGKAKKVIQNQEFRLYGTIILISSVFIGLYLFVSADYGLERSIRTSFFQVASIISTTGYVIENYLWWPIPLWMLIFLLTFLGGTAGSTTGGIKMVRILLIGKAVIREFKRTIHPNAVYAIRLNGKQISDNVLTSTFIFIALYLFIFFLLSLILTISGVDFITSLGAVAATLGNVGPGLGDVGPAGNYSGIPDFSKWVLAFAMLIGRLELFSVLILFAPALWRK